MEGVPGLLSTVYLFIIYFVLKVQVYNTRIKKEREKPVQ